MRTRGEQDLASRSSIRWLIVLLCTLFVSAEYFYYYAELPDKMASRFDAQGQPIGFMAKDRFIGFMAGTWILLLVVLALPMAFVSRMPDSLLNLPHKEYWLAPERSESTRNRLGSCMNWISASTFLFMAYMFHGVLLANLPPHPPLTAWAALVVYLAFIFLLVGFLMWRFWRVPAESS